MSTPRTRPRHRNVEPQRPEADASPTPGSSAGHPARTGWRRRPSGRSCASSPGRTGWPHGLLGRLAGRIMARRDGGPNRRLAELVDPQPGEVILDVGCGPGLALATLARLQPEAVLTGVDVSPVMAAQARRRLAGLAQVIAAPVESLPFPTASFDAACSLNSILFWTDEAAGLAELQRVLRPGGRLVVGVRTRVSTGTDDIGPTGLCPDGVAALRRRLEAAGFTVARVTEHTFADDRFAALHGLRS